MRPPRDSNSTAPPQSPSRAEAARFELAENARLALEAKSAQVEGLKVKLAAAEAALRERDEREREEQAARASSEHAGVMHEADRLGDEMKGALGNVKAFMRRAWTGAGPTASSETDDVTAGNRTPERRATNARDGHTPSSAMRSKAKTSIVEKPAARGAYLRAGGDSPGGDSSLVGRQRPKTVAFVGDREQRRLEREGEVVADNARLRRTVGELERRLKRLARVARRATDAAESKFADERAARLDAEAACERLRAALEEAEERGRIERRRRRRTKGRTKRRRAFGRSLVEELETSRSTCRDVLLVARCAARVNAADPAAIVAALPALAALAGERQGDTAHALADNGVVASAAAAMEAHAGNASVAKAGCELIATLARGGGPSVLRGLAGSARKAAAAVARDFTTPASGGGGGGGGGGEREPEILGSIGCGEPVRRRRRRASSARERRRDVRRRGGRGVGGGASRRRRRRREAPRRRRRRRVGRRDGASPDGSRGRLQGVARGVLRGVDVRGERGGGGVAGGRGGGGCGDEGRRRGRDRGVSEHGAVGRGARSGSTRLGLGPGGGRRRGRRIVARGVRARFRREDRGEGAEEGGGSRMGRMGTGTRGRSISTRTCSEA